MSSSTSAPVIATKIKISESQKEISKPINFPIIITRAEEVKQTMSQDYSSLSSATSMVSELEYFNQLYNLRQKINTMKKSDKHRVLKLVRRSKEEVHFVEGKYEFELTELKSSTRRRIHRLVEKIFLLRGYSTDSSSSSSSKSSRSSL